MTIRAGLIPLLTIACLAGCEQTVSPVVPPPAAPPSGPAWFTNIADDAGRPGIFEIDFNGREFGHKFPHLRRKFVQADAVNGGDLDDPADLADERVHIFL